MEISSSFASKADFKSVNGFLGTIKLSLFGQLISTLLYFTKRCASVATHCIPFLSISKKTPVIAGRRSSLLTANKVLLIAVTRAEEVVVNEVVSSVAGSLGKLSGFSPITLYLPLSLVSSTAKCLSILKVRGWSGIFFRESMRILAGIQTFPVSLASISIWTFMTVSRSVATTVSLFFSTSNRKSSRIGRTVLALITPLICCSCFNKAEEETINFMEYVFGAKLLIRWVMAKILEPQRPVSPGLLISCD